MIFFSNQYRYSLFCSQNKTIMIKTIVKYTKYISTLLDLLKILNANKQNIEYFVTKKKKKSSNSQKLSRADGKITRGKNINLELEIAEKNKTRNDFGVSC